jgi:3-isopropylmalate/(R)-2-methylmalate dehydratase large subunit
LKKCREFALAQGLTHFYDVGRMGIEHVLLPEQGIVRPGDLVIGADSHTCTYGALGAFSTGVGSTDFAAAALTGKVWFKVPSTMGFKLTGAFNEWIGGKDLILDIIGKIGVDGALYKSMEFFGPGVGELSMADRFTVANMAVEAGAKNGVFPFDHRTEKYAKDRGHRGYRIVEADEDAIYESIMEIDLSSIPPQLALPYLPENVVSVDKEAGRPIDQVVIGSCTNGRIEDLRVASSILSGNKVSGKVRLIVIPGSQSVYSQALEEGIISSMIDAGAAVSTPTCGPCLGGYMGILAEGETALSTTNRNFVGRMGHPRSNVILCGPAVAAASALTGVITDPRE